MTRPGATDRAGGGASFAAVASTIATFTKIALIDHIIVPQPRCARARRGAPRGGIRLATALLLEDKLAENQSELHLDHREELWARVSGTPIAYEDGSTLRLEIEDVGARLNLNAVVVFDDAGSPDPKTSELLVRLFDKAIEEIPVPPEEKQYDPAELAAI